MKTLSTFLGLGLCACASTQTAEERANDSVITAKIESKLAGDPETNPFEIDVDTQNGVVRLSGLVEEERAREAAAELASDTQGVTRVINDIQIGDLSLGQDLDDAAITGRVKARLAGDPAINAMDIDVDTTAGIVTLSGLVRSEIERAEAEELASTTEGVQEVENLIEIEGE